MHHDRRTAIALIGVAVLYMIRAWRLPRFPLGAALIDAHVFPLAVGLLLLALSVIYLLRSPAPATGRPVLAGVNLPLLLKLAAAALGYALVLGALGYLMATTLFMLAAISLLGRRSWGFRVTLSAGFATVTYLVFAYALRVPLARGILPF